MVWMGSTSDYFFTDWTDLNDSQVFLHMMVMIWLSIVQSCRVQCRQLRQLIRDSIWLCQLMCLHHLHLEICLSLTSLCQIVRTIRSSGSMKKSQFCFFQFPLIYSRWPTWHCSESMALLRWSVFKYRHLNSNRDNEWCFLSHTHSDSSCTAMQPSSTGLIMFRRVSCRHTVFFGMGAVKVSVWIWCCKHVCLKRMLL